MILHFCNFRLSGASWIDLMIARLPGRHAFYERYNTSGMTLQIWVYAVYWFNLPLDGTHWLCLNSKIHTLRTPDVSYRRGKLLVFVIISNMDSHSKEIQFCLEVGIWLAADERCLWHKYWEQIGLNGRQRAAIFSNLVMLRLPIS